MMNNGEMKQNPISYSWGQLITCPNCGINHPISNSKLNQGHCISCSCPWSLDSNVLTWGATEKKSFSRKWNTFFKKIKNQLNPTSSVLLPFRYLSKISLEKYYKRTISDSRLAARWQNHYIKEMDLKEKDLVLDYGCGRGRITALANQSGYSTVGQDIQQNIWWKNKLSNSYFQVVPPQYTNLPWKNNSFSAIFNFMVLHYHDESKLQKCLQEFFRILKPGGYAIILENNKKGYGAWSAKKQIGRLHSLELVRDMCKTIGFTEVSLTYEGYYARWFPLLINFFRSQLSPKPFDICDFGTFFESITPSERRGFWLMKIQKPKSTQSAINESN